MVMPMTRTTLQQVMADTAVDTTLTMVATMVGLTKDMVTKIVEAGLPMMANVADADPWVFKAMYVQSVKGLPQPTQTFYPSLGKNAKARQVMAADFMITYGVMTETLNRDVASQASASEEQANLVLAATMPTVVNALGKANTCVNEMGFGRQLRNLNA